MISIDQLEILLRTVPQYFLFAALSLYLFSWMKKKTNLGLYGDILLIIVGVLSLTVLLSGMIPSPKEPGLVEEHVQRVQKMLLLFIINGALATISLIWRMFIKDHLKPLVLAIFIISIIIFFQSTSLSKVKFELNKTKIEQKLDSIK